MNTKMGESLAVVGTAATLGAWDSNAASPLQWTEGSTWTSDIDLPIGETVEYKYIIRREGGVTWQPGANMVLTLPKGTLTAEVQDTWQGVHESVQMAQEEVQVEAALTGVEAVSDIRLEATAETVVAAAVLDARALAPTEELVAAAAALEAPNAAEASRSNIKPLDNTLGTPEEEIEELTDEKGRLVKLGMLSILGLGSTSALLALFLAGR